VERAEAGYAQTHSMLAARMVFLHAMKAPPGSALARSVELATAAEGLRPIVGPFLEPIARISGPPALLDEMGRELPEGAAKPEALAIRLRRRGVELSWGEPDVLPDYIDACRARGVSSVKIVRADPSLLTELQLGALFNAYWPSRLLRRALSRAPASMLRRLPFAAAADAAFWAGARSAATDDEWARLSGSSYTVLTYHRLAGERVPGQERLDVDPAMFERHLRWLRRLGFRPLSHEDVIAFHANPKATLPRRSFVLTADDGFRDAVGAMHGHISAKPQLFVNTASVGGVAAFADDRPLASWKELRRLAAAGAAIGSHARTHGRLADSPPELLDQELAGSLHELRTQVPSAMPVLAYPHGNHDEGVRAAAIRAGYRAAFTTETGRNGAGTDPYCLRRVSVKDWDGPLSVLWKALTGEVVPPMWDRWTRLLRRVRLSASR
jgi:peptidoglycan/xylan/chitin deacetylase (PgdA/CDA1 family)